MSNLMMTHGGAGFLFTNGWNVLVSLTRPGTRVVGISLMAEHSEIRITDPSSVLLDEDTFVLKADEVAHTLSRVASFPAGSTIQSLLDKGSEHGEDFASFHSWLRITSMTMRASW